MRLKPKAARRLLLVGIAGVLLVVAAFGLFVVRKWQNERRTQALRTDGMAAYAQQDYFSTLDNLGRYLRRQADDREAWLAFADAREKTEDPRAAHLPQAAVAYGRALALDETDRDTALRLVKLQNQIGYHAEARDQAVRLRPGDISAATSVHFEAMVQEAAARIALKAWDDTLDKLTAQLVSLAPKDYQPAIMRATFLRETDRRDEARSFAASSLAANPGDAGFALLSLLVRVETGESVSIDEFTSTLCAAAGLDKDTPTRIAEPTYTQPQLAGQLLAGFDRLGMYPHSLMVIRDASQRLKDNDFRRLLARRHWQSGQPQALLTDFPAPDASPRGEHSEILAFSALALRNLDRKDEASKLLDALRARDRDFIAKAWSTVLKAVLDTPDPKAALSLVDAGIKEHEAEPTFPYFRGEILSRLGRNEEARAAWESVYRSGVAEGWDAPAVRASETLLDEGRLDEGMVAAQNALQKFRLAPAARLSHLRAQALLIESGRAVPSPADVLRQIEEMSTRLDALNNPQLSLMARRALLPARVALLADSDRKSDASDLIEQVAKDPATLDADLARRLAQVSAREGLGMEDRILEAAGVSGGTLLSRALLMHTGGQPAPAIKLIDDAFANATEATRADMILTRAQFRDAIGHPEALSTWKSAVAAYPDSLAMHLTAIRSQAAPTDSAFVEQIASRIIALGGSDADRPSAEIRFARARALLSASPSVRARDEAVGLLRNLVLEAPARTEFRDALINALLLDDPAKDIRPNYQGAIDQLTAGAAFSNDRTAFTLRLASIYRQQGQLPRAVAELTKLALDSAAETPGRLRAVDLLTELREHEAALRALDTVLSSAPDDPELLLRRGSLLLALRRDREAIDTYQRILRAPLASAPFILNVANALRTLGEPGAAQSALAKLDDPAIAPKDRAMARAAFAAAAGDAATALTEYTRATQLGPDDRQTWSLLARFHLVRGELGPAEAAARVGLEKIPGDSDLTIIREQIRLAGMDDESTDISALADALASNPATARRAEAIRAVGRTRAEGKLDDAAVLGRLADEFVDDPSTQMFVVRRLIAGGPASVAEASRIVRRAAARYANDPSIQEQAARTLIAAGEWEAALAAATAWRALTREPQADVAIGESLLALGRTRQANEAVKDIRIPPAIAPDDVLSLGALNVRVRAAIESGPAAPAFQTLEPHLSSEPVRFSIALPVASMLVKSAADVRTWIEAIASKMDPSSANDQLAIANAWASASDRFPDAKADFLRRAGSAVDQVLSTPDGASAQALSMRSSISNAAGDLPAAVSFARQAIAKEPENPLLVLALARLLMATGTDLAEAESTALGVASGGTAAPEALFIAIHAQLAQSEVAAAAGDQTKGAAKRREAQATLSRLGAIQPLATQMVLEMANLAERMQDDAQAMALYERALAASQPPTGAPLAIVNNNLAYLIYKKATPGSASDALRRAKTLIDEAILIAQLAPFYDTLGSIDIAMGDRSGAIIAFRRAVELDPKASGALVNLADALAGGSAADRAEAATHLQTLAALLASGESSAQLDAEQQSRLLQLRQKLSPR